MSIDMSKTNECAATNREAIAPASKWNPEIGLLIPKDRTLVKVPPNAKLEEATTLMRAYNYSQLPVMEGERKVNGIISWKSIGFSRITQTGVCEVRYYMDDKGSRLIVDETDSLIQVSHIIEEHDYVLVKSQQGAIIGIVTASDLSGEFRDLYEPLYLSGSVELHLRRIIQNANFVDCDFKKAKVDPNVIEKLTLGECCQLIGDKGNWSKLKLKNVDLDTFRKCLSEVTDIRNSVVHFRVREVPDEKKGLLRSFSEFVKALVITQSKQNSP